MSRKQSGRPSPRQSPNDAVDPTVEPQDSDHKDRDVDDTDDQIVDDTSAESFPASDPPGWATGQQRDPDTSGA